MARPREHASWRRLTIAIRWLPDEWIAHLWPNDAETAARNLNLPRDTFQISVAEMEEFVGLFERPSGGRGG